MRGTTAKSFDWLLHRIYFAGIKMEDKKFVMTLFLSLKVWQKVVKTSPAYNINCLIYCILPSLEFHCNVTNKLVFFLYILFDFFQTGTGMSLVTRPVIPPGSTRMEAFRFPRQFWYSKCLWNPSSDNICRVFPLLLKNNKKVRLRCEKLPIVDLIIGRPFAVAPFPMVPIFDVLQQKKYLVTPDVFRGAWVGWTENVNLTFCVRNWVWMLPLNKCLWKIPNFLR